MTAAVFIAAGLAGFAWHARRAAPEPPAVALDGLDPSVAAAVEDARAAVRRKPNSGPAWGRLGVVLHAHQFVNEAETCYARAEQVDPSEPRWPYYLAVLIALRDSAAAIPKLERAVELCGDEPEWPRLKLADALLGLGRYDEARQQWLRVLQRRPDHPLAHLGLARLAFQGDDADDCLAHLRYAADAPQTRKAAHALMAAAYRLKGDSPRAEAELKLAGDLPADAPWPNPYAQDLLSARADKLARLTQAGNLADRGRFPEAVAALNQLVLDYPDFDAAWRVLGFTLYRQGNYAEAEQALDAALKLAPESAEAHYYLGCVSLNQGKHAQAAQHLRRATKIKPDYAAAHYTLAQSLRATGDRAGAAESLRTALRCRPSMAAAHRDLGRLLTQEGKKAEALSHLRNALDLDPADKQAKELLDAVLADGR